MRGQRGMWSAVASGWVLWLAGCSDPQLGSLDRQLAEIRNNPGPARQLVLPEVPDYTALPYEQGHQRSPFMPRLPETEPPPRGSEELAPDLTRSREPLEAYGLDQLALVGTLTYAGRPYALVRAPDGQVHHLRVGNYMGTDFGRVISITSSTVLLTEVVATGGGGWIERTTQLSLDD